MALRRGAAALAAAAAVLAFVLQLRQGAAPPSLVCAAGASCAFDAPLARFRRSHAVRGDARLLRAAAAARFEEARRQGRPPSLLYIGPHYTVHELEPRSMFDYSEQLAPWAPRMVFVDPNPRVIPLLKAKLASLGAPADATEVVHAAVCDEDGEQSFFMASERFFEDKRLDETARRELEFGMSMIRGYTVGAGVPEEYVEEVLVKCLSPPSLLSATSMPDGPDVLLIDAEGYDLGIMQRLLKVERFRPAAISFEWSGAFKMALHLHPQERVEEEFDKWIQPLMTELASAGYALYQDDGDLWATLG